MVRIVLSAGQRLFGVWWQNGLSWPTTVARHNVTRWGSGGNGWNGVSGLPEGGCRVSHRLIPSTWVGIHGPMWHTWGSEMGRHGWILFELKSGIEPSGEMLE